MKVTVSSVKIMMFYWVLHCQKTHHSARPSPFLVPFLLGCALSELSISLNEGEETRAVVDICLLYIGQEVLKFDS